MRIWTMATIGALALCAAHPSWAAEAPAARRDAPREEPPREQPEQPPRELPERPIESTSEPQKAPQSPRRPWLRWALFALLPLALLAGAYWYVTGGRAADGQPNDQSGREDRASESPHSPLRHD